MQIINVSKNLHFGCVIMKKYLDLKGKKIVDKTGTAIGTAYDCIIDYKQKKICSLIIYTKKVLSNLSMISYKNISEIGDYIVINDELYNMNKKIFRRHKSGMANALLGKEIINSTGKRLGTLMDIVFDEKDGMLKALICSNGFFDNILEGRKIFIIDEKTKLSRDKIIVSKENFDITNSISFKKFKMDNKDE